MKPLSTSKTKLSLIVIAFMCSLLILCPGAQANESEPPRAKIVNGTNSAEGAWPWMAFLVYYGSNPQDTSVMCGATVIGSRFVLTAAHCVDGLSTYDLQVFTGRTKLSSVNGTRHNVKRILMHPGYYVDSLALDSDLALIELETETTVTPVALADESIQISYDEQMATLLGWGLADPEVNRLPDDLQEAKVPVIAPDECNNKMGLAYREDTMHCAGVLASDKDANDGVDSCYGDSGGPMVVETENGWTQIGITSSGFGCATDRSYGLYTKVSAFEEWIQYSTALIATVEDHVTRIRNAVGTARKSKKRKDRNELSQVIKAAIGDVKSLSSITSSLSVELRGTFRGLSVKRLKQLKRTLRMIKRAEKKRETKRTFVKARRLLKQISE